jgi:hypothetical protein
LWKDGGRDSRGDKGTGLGTAIKATVDLGISRPLPSVWRSRLAKQVAELWPDFAARRFYVNEERAVAALEKAGVLGREAALPSGAATAGGAAAVTPRRESLIFDPAERPPAPRSRPVLLLRPFAELFEASRPVTVPTMTLGTATAGAAEIGAESAFEVGLLRLPCPRMFAPAILLFRDPSAASRIEEDLVPPLMLATASRSLWEFERFSASYDERLWRKVDRRLGAFFERLGPYLYPRHDASEHDIVFRKALAAGVLISPRHSLPSLVPGDFDDGELSRLAAALGR